MKKILIFFTLVFTVLSLFACAEDKYPPVESTEEESRVVMTLQIDNKKYEVKYELYRALFLNNKSRVDGGYVTVWTSQDKQKYIDEINEIIINDLTEIYSVIHLADEIGFDIYSSSVDDRVKEYIVGAVEGDENQIGHGTYDKYLDSLKNNNLNYSVSTFMMRYAMAEEAVIKYYHGEYDEVKGQLDGKFEYTKEDVEEYYYSDSSRRILQAYFQTGVKTPKQIADYRAGLLALDSDMEIAAYIIGSTMATESDLIKNGKVNGITVGKNELYAAEYNDYINTVFALDSESFSDVILLEGTDADGYYVVYNLEKDADHFENSFSEIRTSYLDNVMGGVLKNMAKALNESAKLETDYSSIVHAEISID